MTTTTTGQRYFDDVSVGEEFTQTHQPSSEDVLTFFNLTRPSEESPEGRESRGNADGRFTDAAGARRQGLERPIVPGTMSMSMVTRLVTDWMGMYGALRSLSVSFRRPVLHDDTLRAVALVTDVQADEAPDPGLGRVKLDVYLENDRGERPVQGTAVVDLPRRS